MLKKLIKLWLPAIVWAGFIFYLSSIPDLKSGLEEFWDLVLRKFAHITEFAILFLLLARPLEKSLKWTLLFSLLYAASDEFHQSFVPGRWASLADFCFDAAGVFLGLFLKSLKKVDSPQKK